MNFPLIKLYPANKIANPTLKYNIIGIHITQICQTMQNPIKKTVMQMQNCCN